MKTNKLSLEELHVDSFITNINKIEKNTIRGGVDILEPIFEALSRIHEACLPLEILEATYSIVEINDKIEKSNANTICAGATHTRCDGPNVTWAPCKV